MGLLEQLGVALLRLYLSEGHDTARTAVTPATLHPLHTRDHDCALCLHHACVKPNALTLHCAC